MSYEWFIARRYLRSRRRTRFVSFISAFTVLGIALGTAALIITLSVLDGFEKEIREKAIGFTSHIQVQGFHGMPLRNFRKSIAMIRNDFPAVKTVTPFVAREAMIRIHDQVDGILLKGIDVRSNVSIAATHIVGGKFLDDTTRGTPQIVIGRKLATKLDANVGDRVVVFGLPDERGSVLQPKAMVCELTGVYETGMAEYDDIYAYTQLENAQKLFQTGDAVLGFDILLHDISGIDRVASQIQDTLGYPHYVRTVFQQYRNLFSWVELQKKLSPILLALIIVVATINIIGTLLMMVLDKTAAIGILRSLGATHGGMVRVFLIQGIALSMVGILAGNVIAYILCELELRFKLISIPADIYYMSSVPILIRPENFVLVSLVTLVLCALTSLVPSRAAARLDTVLALRFG